MAIASGSRYSCSNLFIKERALGHNTYFVIKVISEEALVYFKYNVMLWKEKVT